MSFDSSFIQLQRRITAQLQSLRVLVGNDMVNFALDNHRKQAYVDEAWPTRKGKQKGRSRALLVKTGRLRRAHRFQVTEYGARYYNDTPYAAVHNFGGTINRTARSETFVRNRHTTGKRGKMFGGMGAFAKGTTRGRGQTYRAYSYQMPRRQFIGRHPELLKTLRNTSLTHLKKAFK